MFRHFLILVFFGFGALVFCSANSLPQRQISKVYYGMNPYDSDSDEQNDSDDQDEHISLPLKTPGDSSEHMSLPLGTTGDSSEGESESLSCGEDPNNFDEECCAQANNIVQAERTKLERQGYYLENRTDFKWSSDNKKCYIETETRRQSVIACNARTDKSSCCDLTGCQWIRRNSFCGDVIVTEKKGRFGVSYKGKVGC